MSDNDQPVVPADQGLSPEIKVGLFVLSGLVVLVFSILMLGDIKFSPQNNFEVFFKNVEGLSDKSPVKISGVEVGSVKKIELADHNARITMAIRKDIAVYANARTRIRSTGIIGTKYLALDPGAAQPGQSEASQRLQTGAKLVGDDIVSLDELMERVAKSMDDLTGGGTLGENLNATMKNLRGITDSLNAAIGQQRRTMVNIVQNIEGFTSYAKSVAAHLDDVMTTNKKDIQEGIVNIKETFARLNDVLGKVQRGEGAVGALLNDPQVGQDMKDTVTNLKQTSESAKDILARFTKIRAFWSIGMRRDFDASTYRADLGLRIEPRPNKFYFAAGENLGNENTTKQSPKDFERPNTVTAILGRHWGPWTGALGFIKSRGGVEGRYRPFQDTETPVLNRMELGVRAFDFGRDDVRKDRRFDSPNVEAGVRFRVNQYVTAGVESEDILEVSDTVGTVNVAFEDKDIGYLLGFVSFAR